MFDSYISILNNKLFNNLNQKNETSNNLHNLTNDSKVNLLDVIKDLDIITNFFS